MSPARIHRARWLRAVRFLGNRWLAYPGRPLPARDLRNRAARIWPEDAEDRRIAEMERVAP